MRLTDDPRVEWAESFWRRRDPAQPGGRPVAFGGSLTAAGLLATYRHGLLPMPAGTAEDAEVNELLYADEVRAGGIAAVGAAAPTFDLAWWSPDPRPVLTAGTVRLGSGLTKTLRTRRGWVTTVNQAFDQVLAGCRTGRDPRWLTDDLVEVLTELHGQGWYHSLEVWDGPDLVGGAVGLGLGATLSCDSMFHRRGGASQIALADLAVRLSATPARALDLQWDSPHVRRLGAQFLDRPDFLRLAAGSAGRVALPGEARTVDDLLARLRGRRGIETMIL